MRSICRRRVTRLFYHALMMSDGLEERGQWEAGEEGLGDEQALAELAARVHDDGDKTTEEALSILTHAFEKQHVIRRDEGRNVRFLWNDRLEGVAVEGPTTQRMAAVAC